MKLFILYETAVHFYNVFSLYDKGSLVVCEDKKGNHFSPCNARRTDREQIDHTDR